MPLQNSLPIQFCSSSPAGFAIAVTASVVGSVVSDLRSKKTGKEILINAAVAGTLGVVSGVYGNVAAKAMNIKPLVKPKFSLSVKKNVSAIRTSLRSMKELNLGFKIINAHATFRASVLQTFFNAFHSKKVSGH